MNPTMTGLIGFAVLIFLMFLRMPVGFVMALVGYLGFGYIISWNAASSLIIRDFYSTFSSYNLTVIPLFVLMGQVAFHSGISTRLFNAAHKFFGHLPEVWPSPLSAPALLFPPSAAPPAPPRPPWLPWHCLK